MQHLYGANVVALLSGEVETVFDDDDDDHDVTSRAPRMKAAVVVVALFDFPTQTHHPGPQRSGFYRTA